VRAACFSRYRASSRTTSGLHLLAVRGVLRARAGC
jgi:hypothetical protein